MLFNAANEVFKENLSKSSNNDSSKDTLSSGDFEKRQQVFDIQKEAKRQRVETASYLEDSLEKSDSEDPTPAKVRVLASSKVNFSKLNDEEKEMRCHNLAKEVKQLRRKIRNMEGKVLKHKVPPVQKPPTEDVKYFESAQEKLKQNSFELHDQGKVIANLCKAIVENRLPVDSLAFEMIAT
jgi:hypothetical protein